MNKSTKLVLVSILLLLFSYFIGMIFGAPGSADARYVFNRAKPHLTYEKIQVPWEYKNYQLALKNLNGTKESEVELYHSHCFLYEWKIDKGEPIHDKRFYKPCIISKDIYEYYKVRGGSLFFKEKPKTFFKIKTKSKSSICPTKKGASKNQNKWICEAWKMNPSQDMIVTFDIESGGSWNPWKKANNGENSWGFCQIHAGYHPNLYVNGKRFSWSGSGVDIRDNPSNMMKWCVDKYKNWMNGVREKSPAPMYGYCVGHKGGICSPARSHYNIGKWASHTNSFNWK